MSETDIKNWKAAAQREKEDVNIVIRGLIGRHIPETLFWIKDNFDGANMRDGVQGGIDFRPFDKFKVDRVPAVAYSCNKEALVVFGSVGFKRVKEMFDEGVRESQTLGQTVAIKEKHFMEDIQERMANAKLEERAKENLDKYWERQRPVVGKTLKPAKRILNMRFQTPEDILIDKQVTPAGTIFEIDTCVSFDVIAFDARDKKQVDWALKSMQAALANNRRPKLVSSAFTGWKQVTTDLPELFGMNVYQLTEEFRNAFDILSVPTYITPEQIHGTQKCRYIAYEVVPDAESN